MLKTREKVALGLAAGAGALWGTRAWLRSRRRIDLDDRVVIVTGGTSGLGLMIAHQAAERGGRLVLAARDAGALEAAEAELRRMGARDVLGVPTDVADMEQVRALVDRTIERHGRIDVLINDAGIITVGPAQAMTLDDYRRVMAVNFYGALHTTLAVVPHMRARGFGRIGNVVSIGGRAVMPRLLPYTASKYALTGLTKGLRAELARENILVTGLYPMTIRTGGHTHAWFKGRREAEYTWFGLSDTLPVLSASAERAARKFWDGILHGDPEVIVGWPTRVAIVGEGLFPEWLDELRPLVDWSLPAKTHLDAPAAQGQHLHGAVPDMLNRMVPDSARPDPTGNGR